MPGHPDEAETAAARRGPRATDAVYLRLARPATPQAFACAAAGCTSCGGGRPRARGRGRRADARPRRSPPPRTSTSPSPTPPRSRPFDRRGAAGARSDRRQVVLVEPYLAGTSVGGRRRALQDRPHRVLGLGVGRRRAAALRRRAEHDRPTVSTRPASGQRSRVRRPLSGVKRRTRGGSSGLASHRRDRRRAPSAGTRSGTGPPSAVAASRPGERHGRSSPYVRVPPSRNSFRHRTCPGCGVVAGRSGSGRLGPARWRPGTPQPGRQPGRPFAIHGAAGWCRSSVRRPPSRVACPWRGRGLRVRPGWCARGPTRPPQEPTCGPAPPATARSTPAACSTSGTCPRS